VEPADTESSAATEDAAALEPAEGGAEAVDEADSAQAGAEATPEADGEEE
jgi:hypothetical protein